MTFPKRETMISFGEAQEAIAAVADAYNRAIDSVITDEALKAKLMATTAGNVFETMLSKINLDGRQPGEFDNLFARLFGP